MTGSVSKPLTSRNTVKVKMFPPQHRANPSHSRRKAAEIEGMIVSAAVTKENTYRLGRSLMVVSGPS